ELCKADLTTGMIGEFPELQGAMGRVYALHEGAEPAVADAIFEHYLPRGAEDRLPSGDVGALLGIADRLDLLAGLFGLGKEPTGARDLVALEERLTALQMVREKSRAQFEATAAAFKRIGNILLQAQQKGIAPVGFQERLCKTPSEKALAAALEQGRARVSAALAEKEDYLAAYAALAELRPVVDRLFDEVMVMDPDAAQRDNRLALLRALHELFAPLADFSRLQVEKSS